MIDSNLLSPFLNKGVAIAILKAAGKQPTTLNKFIKYESKSFNFDLQPYSFESFTSPKLIS